MKVTIEATQEEFDEKRGELLKSLAGNKFEIIQKARTETVYNMQKPAIALRRSFYTAQNQMMDYWDERFQETMSDLKKDIEKIIGEK